MSEEQYQDLGGVRSYRVEGRAVLFECAGGLLSVAALTPEIWRVRASRDGALAAPRSWAVARPDEEFAPLAPAIMEREGAEGPVVVVDAGAVRVEVGRADGRLSFVDAAGRRFCADGRGVGWGAKGPSCEKQIEAGEHFYGFGERSGPLDKLGRGLVNWTTDPPGGHGPGTDPLYMAIPVFMALRPGLAYGIFFNNTWRSQFDIGRRRPGCWSMAAEGGELDYYLCYGPTPPQVSAGLGEVLGRMPLPPRWALGYHQSRWSYETHEVVGELADEFRRRDIPCDAIHLDIDYMDGYRVFTWHPRHFSDPAGLLARLGGQGFKVVTIIDPGVKIDPDYHVYREGMERGYFLRRADGEVFHGYVWPDDSVFSDYTRPEVRAWWGDLQRALVELGVKGIWNDMNEPTVFKRPFSQGGGQPFTIELDVPQGPPEEQTIHAEVHNLYGSGMAQASYDGLRRHLGGERPFVLTRSAFAGIQRWSAGWMGDNSSWWEHLEMCMPQLMNMGLSGVAFVGVDIGGFFGNASAELFARWVQLGALLPFCRGHSSLHTERHEPWVFGERVEAISRQYLKLRYRLLPYLYTLFWQAAQEGAPIMRPLLYHFPDDPATYHLHDQLLLGPSLMAAPIYQPGREHRHVYLPAGRWYDWWSGEQIEGPAHILAHAPLERLPLYVRGGSIIPLGPELRYADERPLSPLTLAIYPGDGELTLYEDDGRTFAYEHGEWCTTRFELREEPGQLTLAIGARAGAYVPPPRRLIVRLHAVSPAAQEGHPGHAYDPATRMLSLELDDDGAARTLTFRR